MKELQAIADSMLPLFDNMPPVRIRFGTFYEVGPMTSGFYQNGTIIIRDDAYEKDSPDTVRDTIKHEMIHAWVDWKAKTDPKYREHVDKHSEPFFIKAALIGFRDNFSWTAREENCYRHAKAIVEKRSTFLIKGSDWPIAADRMKWRDLVPFEWQGPDVIWKR